MTEKIRVLHIIKSLGRGGAETLLPESLKLHNKDHFEWHYIYFLPWKNQMVSALENHGGKVTCIKASNNIQILLRAGKVINYVRQHNINLIHSHLPWAGILSRLVKKKLKKIPVIYTEHNKLERYHFITRWMNLATMNFSTFIVAVSKDVSESIYKHKHNLKNPVQVIPNGVNTNYFAPGIFDGKEVRQSLGIPMDAPVIGTIAVFRFQKRLDIWIENATRIAQKYPGAHFIIVGDGPLKDFLLRKCLESDILDRIHFVGLKTEVRPYLAAFDIYMMSSIFEGLPIALLEAMASGCPVVSTDAGGVKEVIRHNIDGIMCDVDCPTNLSDLVVELLESVERKNNLRLQARRRIQKEFSMEKMVESLERLYMSAVQRSN